MWEQLPETVQVAAQWAGWLIVLGGLIAKLVTTALRSPAMVNTWLGRYFERRTTRQRKDDLLGKLIEREDQLIEILSELRPNCGNSFFDKIGQLSEGVENSIRLTSHIEERVQFNSGLLLSLMNDSKEPMWQRDAEGKILWVNQAYEDLVGHSFDEIRGWNWKNIVHPDDRRFVSEQWSDAIREIRNHEITFRVVRSNGTPVRVHSSGHPILDGDGRLLGWAGSTHPVISVAQEGATGGMKPAAPHLRVMWVDDSEDALDFARLYFKNFAHGIELFATPTGGDAIQAYSNALMLGKPFDVVILDYMMLGMNGAEVARVIRHQEKLQSTGQSSHHARIAFCSGADEQISVEVCNELDVSRRFPKPFVIAEVAEWIKSGR